MTDPNYTAMLLVIDRSGSMITIRDDMVGGLQGLVADQASEPGMLTVDVVTFDTVIDWQHHFADPADVRIELEPRGGTALYDALGASVAQFGQELAKLPEHARPSTVQVVVVTDGEENSSTEWTAAAVRQAVSEQTEKYGWDFVFLGANQDAALAAHHLGIAAESALDYSADVAGVAASSLYVSRYMTDVRAGSKKGFTSEERRTAKGGE